MKPLAFILPMSAAFAAGACSASSGHPPLLGDCVPADDASCATVSSGGGGSGRPDGGGPQDASASDAGSLLCSAEAGSFVVTSNPQCQPCIAASCCQAYEECGAQAACLAIGRCAAGSINTCENENPSGVAGYDDLAACLMQNCTSCPVLPLGTTGDI